MAQTALRFGIVTNMSAGVSYALPARGGNVIISDVTGLQSSIDEVTWTNVNPADLNQGINGRFLKTPTTNVKISITQL